MLRSTLIAIATLFIAGLVVFVAAAVISDDSAALEIGFLLLFPFEAIAFLAVLVAVMAESKSPEIAWRAVGSWLLLTVVVGFVWLNVVAAWGMAGHAGEPVQWSWSEPLAVAAAIAVYALPAALITIRLWRRSRA